MSVGNWEKNDKTRFLLAKISLTIDLLLDVVYFCRYSISNIDRMLYNMMPCILLLIFSFLFFRGGTCRVLGVIALIFWGIGKLSDTIRIVNIYGAVASISLLDILVQCLQVALVLLFIAMGIWGTRHRKMLTSAAVIFVVTEVITVLSSEYTFVFPFLALSDIFFGFAIFLLWPLVAERIWRQRHCREITQSLEAALLQAKAQYENGQLTESAYCAIKAELLQRL